MTFSQSWPSDYGDQVQYIKDLLAFTQTQDANSAAVGLAQDTAPTSNEINDAWTNYIGDARPLPVGAKVLWYDTSRSVLDQIYSTTNDVGGVGSTGVSYQLSPKRKSLDMGVIAFDNLQAQAAIAPSLSGASALWTCLWCISQTRYGVVAGGPVGWRGQNVGTLYFGERIQITGGAGRTAIATDSVQVANGMNNPGNTDQPFNSGYYNCFIPHPFNATKDKIFIGMGGSLSQTAALPIAAAARIAAQATGHLNAVAALTSIALSTNADPSPVQEVGSNYVVYGLK